MNDAYNAVMGQNQPFNMGAGAPANNGAPQDWNALMGQLQANPGEMIRDAGYNVPDELVGNPQATVMHLIRSGQVGGPMMQRIQPLLHRMGVR